MEKETAAKTAAEKVPQRHGGALLTGGVPGNRGGGRPRDEWRELCQELASREDVLQVAEAILLDKDHPMWLQAWKWVGEQGYGRAQASVDVSGSAFSPAVVILPPEVAERI